MEDEAMALVTTWTRGWELGVRRRGGSDGVVMEEEMRNLNPMRVICTR